MPSFLDIIRGPRRDFDPEREIRHLPVRSAKLTTQDLLADLRCPVALPTDSTPPEEDLRRQIKDIRKARDDAVREHNKLRTALTFLRQQKIELEFARGELEKQLRMSKTRETTLQEQLDMSRVRENVLQAEKAALQDMLDATNVLVDELLADKALLQSDNAQLLTEQQTASDDLQALEGTLAALRAENASLKAKLAEKDEKIQEGKAELGLVMTELALEKEKTRSLEAEVAQLKSQLAEKEVRFIQEADSFELERNMYRSQEQQASAQADEEHQARLDAEKTCEVVRDERDKALARVAELNDIVNKQGDDIQELRDTLAAATVRVEALMAEKEGLLQRLERLQDDLGNMQQLYHDAKQSVKKLNQDLRRTEGALKEVQAIVPIANSSDEELVKRVVLLEKSNLQLQASKKALEDEHFSMVQSLDGAKSELFRLRNASQGSISPPGSPSGSGPLPLGNGNSFNVAPQLEAGSPPAKSRSFFRFFGKQYDENAKVSSPALA